MFIYLLLLFIYFFIASIKHFPSWNENSKTGKKNGRFWYMQYSIIVNDMRHWKLNTYVNDNTNSDIQSLVLVTMQTIPVWAFKDTAGPFNQHSRVQDMEQRNVNKAVNKSSTSFRNSIEFKNKWLRARHNLFPNGFNFLLEYFTPRSLEWTASNLIAISKGVFRFAYCVKKKKITNSHR